MVGIALVWEKVYNGGYTLLPPGICRVYHGGYTPSWYMRGMPPWVYHRTLPSELPSARQRTTVYTAR